MKTHSRSFLTLSLMLLVGCEGGEATELAESAAPAVDVWVVPVRAETIVEPIIGTGSIAAHKTSNIGPRVDGIIEEIYVRVGDRVEAGAPFFVRATSTIAFASMRLNTPFASRGPRPRRPRETGNVSKSLRLRELPRASSSTAFARMMKLPPPVSAQRRTHSTAPSRTSPTRLLLPRMQG